MNENTRQKILKSAQATPGIHKLDSKRLRAELARLASQEPPPDYDRYMRSKSWQIKRRKFLAHYTCQCVLCGSKDHLHVHHLHYQTIGSETPEDVIVCCRRCHFIEHLPHNDDPNWAGTKSADKIVKGQRSKVKGQNQKPKTRNHKSDNG